MGYMGKISASEKAEYEAKGYETSALVGKEGIEGKYESVLKRQRRSENRKSQCKRRLGIHVAKDRA